MSPKPKATSSKKCKDKLDEPAKPSKKRKNPDNTKTSRKKPKSTPEATNLESENNILPQICHSHWNKFENDLKTQQVDEIAEEVKATSSKKSKNKLEEPEKQSKKQKNQEHTKTSRKKLKSTRKVNEIAEEVKATSSKKTKNNLEEPEKPNKKQKNPEPTKTSRKKTKSTPEVTNPESEINILPQICHLHWNKFENDLKTRQVDKIDAAVNACAARMHSCKTFNNHFLTSSFLRLAIVDALLNRKWDNLLRLVIKLGRNYMEPVFRMHIRHLCQILKTYHPAIRGTEIEDQIDLVVEKFEKKETRNNLTNVV